MILGLIGRNGAGKGEVAKILELVGFEYFSLSDMIRDELRQQGREVTRENLIQMGNELRRLHGPGVLAEKVLRYLEPDKNYVIDSIRNPLEVDVLRRSPRFRLIKVEADEEVRFQRIVARKRESDPETLEEFKRLEKAELESEDISKQNLRGTEALADDVVSNNGTLEELAENTRIVVRRLSQTIVRPSWDKYFMDIAQQAALRSNCIKRKVAAIIVKDKRIISTGYNGTPRGVVNCNEGGCPRCNALGESGKNLDECYCSHAEENAIVQASYHGVSINGATIYTTFSPCLLCTKMILNAGISEVVYFKAYSMAERPLLLLQEAQVDVRQILKD